MKSINLVCLPLALALTPAVQASSYESQQGVIAKLSINSPDASNRNVMVWLEGVGAMCTISSNNDSGYFNRADAPSVFNVMVASLLAAKLSNKQVALLVIPGAEGCRIDRVEVL